MTRKPADRVPSSSRDGRFAINLRLNAESYPRVYQRRVTTVPFQRDVRQDEQQMQIASIDSRRKGGENL